MRKAPFIPMENEAERKVGGGLSVLGPVRQRCFELNANISMFMVTVTIMTC